MNASKILPLLFVTLNACTPKGPDHDPENGPFPLHQAQVYVRFRKPAGGFSPSTINLSRPELNSLKSAMAAGGRGAEGSAIEVDAENGKLVFRPRDSAGSSGPHAPAEDSEIALAESGGARKLVATPAARQLMENKPPH